MVDCHATFMLRLGGFAVQGVWRQRRVVLWVGSCLFLDHFSIAAANASMYDNADKGHTGIFQLRHQIQQSESATCLAGVNDVAFKEVAIYVMLFRKFQVLQMLPSLTEPLCQASI